MPLLDLVTPWAAVSTTPELHDAFHLRWAGQLDLFRQQRVPLALRLSLAEAGPLANALTRAGDPSLTARLRGIRETLDELGVSPPKCTTILVASDVPGEAHEAIPSPGDPLVVLCLDRIPDDAALMAAWARALTALARWVGPGPSPMVPLAASRPWDVWRVAREVPLAEWVYTAGLAEHTVQAVLPGIDAATQFGLSRSAMQRLREQERSLRARLAADLPLAGLGPWLRWMAPGAPPSVRSDGGPPIPVGAARYLAWRLTTDRVNRIGLGAAITESAAT